jgi:hypothetical protein
MNIRSGNILINASLLALLALLGLAGAGLFALCSFSFLPAWPVVAGCQWLLPLLVAVAVAARRRPDIQQFQIVVLYKQFGVAAVLLPLILFLALWPCGWLASRSAAFAVGATAPRSIVSARLVSVHAPASLRFSFGGAVEAVPASGAPLRFSSREWWSLKCCVGGHVELHERSNAFGTVVESARCAAASGAQ